MLYIQNIQDRSYRSTVVPLLPGVEPGSAATRAGDTLTERPLGID
jgi:hypothetical protein